MLRPAYPIRTPRLILRPFSPDDLEAVHAYHSDPEVVRYLYWQVAPDRDATGEGSWSTDSRRLVPPFSSRSSR